ncbi:MAG: DNA-binding MarR family transcriptional regulator [Glaciecola sp.]|jgi:DNA-binding MarR family transcriptional regulator|uniref:MarR family winged helix-turn-helix transcriptional regulator n=1 Tax=Psychromonas sp. TaxID=1884585 RepID=UPI0039E43A8F
MLMDPVQKKVQQWSKEMPNLNTKPMALISRLQQTTKEMNGELYTNFEDYKLTDAGFDVLATLLRAGPPHSLSPSELLEQMDITSGTMTTRIDKLEKKDLVKRKIKKNDKRGVNVALTKKGLKLIEEAIVAHVKTQEKIVSVFDEEEQLIFISLLQKYLAHNVKKSNKRHI